MSVIIMWNRLEAVDKLHKMIVFVFNLLHKIERTSFYILSIRKKTGRNLEVQNNALQNDAVWSIHM